MKTYSVKKIFGPTIQGEGKYQGRSTVFVRFSGCNMWNGIEADKAASKCPYCDTDFFGGVKMTAKEIVAEVFKISKGKSSLITFSGGEPMLQLDEELLEAFVDVASFEFVIETNGTVEIPEAISDICAIACSPKVPAELLKVRPEQVEYLKILYPHPNPEMTPESYFDWAHENIKYNSTPLIYIQPINNKDTLDLVNIKKAIEKTIEFDAMLSIQIHKVIGVE
jgi:organic radical activating enzyme